ncbi:hypothetical protein MHYP_G00178560 [Metynnis hypsauchen]
MHGRTLLDAESHSCQTGPQLLHLSAVAPASPRALTAFCPRGKRRMPEPPCPIVNDKQPKKCGRRRCENAKWDSPHDV